MTDFANRIENLLDHFQTGSSEEKKLHLHPDVDKYAVIAALSSNLWFWYLMTTSDCRHLGNRDISTFPFDPRSVREPLCKELAMLGRNYVDDLRINSKKTVRVYKRKGPKVVYAIEHEANEALLKRGAQPWMKSEV